MTQEHNTFWLSLFIIIGLPVLLWLAGWFFVKLWRDPSRSRSHACPHCQRQGQITSFGTFQCISCGQEFYVSESGRDLPSLWRALMGTLVGWVICGSLIMAIDIHLER